MIYRIRFSPLWIKKIKSYELKYLIILITLYCKFMILILKFEMSEFILNFKFWNYYGKL